VLSLMLVFITILTTLTLTATITAYAGGDNDDGNKQKAEDDSAAAIADCDDNDVERAGFDCIALATNDVEIETEEEPPEESATLFVCKEVEGNEELEPFDFQFSATGPGVDIQFPGVPANEMGNDCPPGSVRPGEVAPGEYLIRELVSSQIPPPDSIEVEGDCTQIDPPDDFQTLAAATVEIQEGDLGETLICTFTNIYEGGDS
jgi:hypothetical protein